MALSDCGVHVDRDMKQEQEHPVGVWCKQRAALSSPTPHMQWVGREKGLEVRGERGSEAGRESTGPWMRMDVLVVQSPAGVGRQLSAWHRC